MHRLAAKLALVAVLVAAPAIGRATVLHVERDGSGDFGTIADAMNAAAVGDTILLGLGLLAFTSEGLVVRESSFLENASDGPATGTGTGSCSRIATTSTISSWAQA